MVFRGCPEYCIPIYATPKWIPDFFVGNDGLSEGMLQGILFSVKGRKGRGALGLVHCICFESVYQKMLYFVSCMPRTGRSIFREVGAKRLLGP